MVVVRMATETGRRTRKTTETMAVAAVAATESRLRKP
jgi:hypothetical protein